MTTTLAAGTVCRPGSSGRGWVVLDGPVIADVGFGAHPGPGATDLGDTILTPGFVDLQVNGVGDVDYATADASGWSRGRRALLESGTTSFCPTFVTAPLDWYPDALARADAARTAATTGATIVGVHLEGPFLGGAPGAHPVDLLRPADATWLGALIDAQPGLVRMMTLAPEADPDLAATRLLVERGVTVALGHSTASFEAVIAAADAGATAVTHLFNGMGPLGHRAPGLVGAALADERLTASLIADLVHVHPAVLGIAIAAKRGVALTTDRVALNAGRIGGLSIVDRGGTARLPDGTLAGSTLSLDQAVRNVVALGVPLERAIEMATSIPAEALGLQDRGRLVPGARADLVALDPESLAVRGVWLAGTRVPFDD